MFYRTLSLYKNAYSGLAPSTWWLSMVMLINRSGTMVLPFLTIYLTSPEMGYSISKAGVVMALFGLGAVAGAFVGGKLTDKIGFHKVQIATLIGGGVLFMVLGQMTTFPLICCCTFLLSFVNEAFRPANATAIVAYSTDENRTRSYAMNRLAVNLGWAVGNAIGGLLASINYHLLFWVDGFTNITAALLLWRFLHPSTNPVKHTVSTHKSIDKAHSAYRDKVYLFFIVLTFIFASCFFQLFTNLTAWYRNEMHFSERFIGLLGAVNGLMIVFIEMILIFRLEKKNTPIYYIMRGIILCGVAYLILSLFPVTQGLALIMVMTMTMGEILSFPFMNTFWVSRTSSVNRGQYAALYTIAWAAARTCGPLVAAQVAQYAGFSALWWGIFVTCILCCAGFYRLHILMNRAS